MSFRRGLRDWGRRFVTIATSTRGIERWVGLILHSLTLISLTQWMYIGFGSERNRSAINTWTDLYVLGVLAVSILFFFFPCQLTGWLSTYISATTLIAVLNIVLLQRVFGAISSPERSLLLFMCNVAQIIFMFATWYFLYGEKDPLLTSVLTFATISHSVSTPKIAMAQIATDFVLLAVYLSHLVGRVGARSAS